MIVAATVDYELNELKREFLDEAGEKVDEMQSIVDRGLRDAASLDRLTYLAHQLKGSGGSYGYSQISEDAAELEKAIETLAGEGGDTNMLEGKLRTHVGNLRRAIDDGITELV